MRSLPRKENGKARTSIDEKSVRKSHGHHIPPAKGMGERALLLLGLLSLLTAADEVRHANAQHRATSDPSEGHAVEAGEREVGALLIGNGEVNHAVSGVDGSNETLIVCVIHCKLRVDHFSVALSKAAALNGERDAFVAVRVIVARCGRDLCEDISALIETDNVNLALFVRGELGSLGVRLLYSVSINVLILDSVAVLFLKLKHNPRELLRSFLITNLGDVNAVGVIVGRVLDGGAGGAGADSMRVVRVGQSDGVLLTFAEHGGANLRGVKPCLIVHIDL